MSVNLPAPAETIDLLYGDVTATLSFDTSASLAEVVSFYRTTLAKAGWEGTTEKPVQLGFKSMMIFRNPQKDMLTLEMYEVYGKNRILPKHQSATEIAELERQIKTEAEKKKEKQGVIGRKLGGQNIRDQGAGVK